MNQIEQVSQMKKSAKLGWFSRIFKKLSISFQLLFSHAYVIVEVKDNKEGRAMIGSKSYNLDVQQARTLGTFLVGRARVTYGGQLMRHPYHTHYSIDGGILYEHYWCFNGHERYPIQKVDLEDNPHLDVWAIKWIEENELTASV